MPHITQYIRFFLCTYKEVEKEPAIMIKTRQQVIFEISQINQSISESRTDVLWLLSYLE